MRRRHGSPEGSDDAAGHQAPDQDSCAEIATDSVMWALGTTDAGEKEPWLSADHPGGSPVPADPREIGGDPNDIAPVGGGVPLGLFATLADGDGPLGSVSRDDNRERAVPAADRAEGPETGSLIADRFWRAPADRIREFVRDSCRTFIEQTMRTAAYAHGAGAAFDVVFWTARATEAVKGLDSDSGTTVSVPFPVGGLDFLVSLELGDGPVPSMAVSGSVARADEPLIGMFEISPAKHGRDVDRTADTDPGADDERIGIPLAQGADLDAPTVLFSGDGRAALVLLDLSDLRPLSPQRRLGALMSRAEAGLRRVLADDPSTDELELIVGCDPHIGLCFWLRLDDNQDVHWQVKAGLDPSTGRLAIHSAEPCASKRMTTCPTAPYAQRVAGSMGTSRQPHLPAILAASSQARYASRWRTSSPACRLAAVPILTFALHAIRAAREVRRPTPE